MNTMHEALARERLARYEAEARHARQVSHLVAARRWDRLERLATRARARHVRRSRTQFDFDLAR
jgi:hypothetical protein